MNAEALPIPETEHEVAGTSSNAIINNANPNARSSRRTRTSKPTYVFLDPESDEDERPAAKVCKKKNQRSKNRSRWARFKKCEACGEELPYRTLKSRRSFKTHKETHVNGGLFVCPYVDCLKAYVQEKRLKEHIHMYHFLVRSLICQKCNVPYRNEACLRRHSCRTTEQVQAMDVQ